MKESPVGNKFPSKNHKELYDQTISPVINSQVSIHVNDTLSELFKVGRSSKMSSEPEEDGEYRS